MPKEKRDKLILVAIGTAVVCAGLWFGLISNVQKKTLASLKSAVTKKQMEVESGKRFLDSAEEVEVNLEAYTKKLNEIEDTMAPAGNLYAWLVNSMHRFMLQLPYPVEIPLYTQPVVGDANILPKFPYKSATYTVRGNAYFHDFGKFLAAFENRFPHIRIQNLELDPQSSGPGEEKDREKLAFKMEIVALIKPTP